MDVSLESLKVMVIDDSKTIRRTAETLLKKAGCTVVTATDGFDALAKIADTRPDIIFVDIMMPRLDGYQPSPLLRNNTDSNPRPGSISPRKNGCLDRARERLLVSDRSLRKPLVKTGLA